MSRRVQSRTIGEPTPARGEVSGGQLMVVMMRASDVGNGHNGATTRGLGGAAERRVLVERERRPPVVVAGETGTQVAPKRPVPPDDDVVETPAADRADQARDTRLDRTVGIKVLPAGAAVDPDRRRRFEQEARAASVLNQPHVCVLDDIGSQDPSTLSTGSGQAVDHVVMEHLMGETLSTRLAKGPLPVDEALAAAHKQGIIHRDLKPGNVMLTQTGVRLLDFGLATLRAPGAALGADFSSLPTQAAPETEKGTILGTLAFMAPDQFEGKDADAHSDLFAVGAVLYEMLTGRRAFEGTSPASVISAVMWAQL